MPRDVRVAILGDARDFQRAVRQASGDAGKLGGSFGGLKKLAGGLALGVAAREVFDLGASFVAAAEESQKVTRQTDAVIKSMGNTANVSAKQVADLSTSLSLKSGIDDEVIQSGSNVLLTFRNIRNEVGRGNKIFDRANAAALDMSVALKKDLGSSAITVGKALNDPVKGLTALGRAGVQFTDQQKAQIKAMVAAGDVAGAQKIILGELESQFAGSAAAQATATDKLRVAWDNVKEQLGAALLPVVEKVATWLAAHLPSAIERAKAFINSLRPTFQAIVEFVRTNWPQIQETIASVMESIQAVIDGVLSVVQTLWANFGDNILSFVRRVWPAIQQTISGALEVIRGVIKVITSLIRGDWSGVWEGIKAIVHGAFNVIVGRIKSALELARLAVSVALELIGSIFRGAFNGMLSFLAGLPGRVGRLATITWDRLKSGLREAVRWILDQLDRILGPLDEIAGKVGSVVGKLGGAAGSIGGMLGFAQGGTVPGARGKPRLILAHGGEHITQASAVNRAGGTAVAFPSSVTLVVDGQQFAAQIVANGQRQGARRGVAA